MRRRQLNWNLRLCILMCVLGPAILWTCSKREKKGSALSMREFVPEEILGWKLQDTVETYDPETIFDYIDGAGEVYRSFNLRMVMVFRFAKPEQPGITVELFDMGSAEDAYGVFSHAREEQETGIGQDYQYQGGLLCFWQADFFACLLSEKESTETKDAIFALARRIEERLPRSGSRPELVGYLPEDGLISQSTRFFHLPSSLNYHYFLSDRNILNLNRQTRAVLASYEPGSTYLLCVQYPSARQANQGYSSFVENYVPEAGRRGTAEIDPGKWVAVSLVQEYVIIALDAAAEDDAIHLTEAFVARLSKATR